MHKQKFALILSMLFFFRKGIQYLLLGSYFPIVIVTTFSGLLLTTYFQKKTQFLFWAKVWSYLVILWAIARLLLAIIHHTINPLDEYHLDYQFGATGMVISIIMLLIAIYTILQIKGNQVEWIQKCTASSPFNN